MTQQGVKTKLLGVLYVFSLTIPDVVLAVIFCKEASGGGNSSSGSSVLVVVVVVAAISRELMM